MEAIENSLIEVILLKDFVVLTRDHSSLWCCRKTGDLSLGSEVDYSQLDSPVQLGKAWGYIGKLKFFTDGKWKLLLITQASCIGHLPQGGDVYCIDKISIIPLTIDPSLEVIGMEVSEQFSLIDPMSFGLGSDLSFMIPNSANVGSMKNMEKPKELRDREKVERRLTEALLWMFNDSRSFYFSMDFDLTQSLQRKRGSSTDNPGVQLPFWQRVDERFFWNKWMISDLIGDNYQGDHFDPWILPIIQGYIEIRQMPINSERTPDILQPGWNSRYADERKRINSDVSLKVPLAPSTLEKKGEDPYNFDSPPPDDLGSGYESDSESDGDSNVDMGSSSTEDILHKLLEDIDKEPVKVPTEMTKEPEQTNEKLKGTELQSDHSVASVTDGVKGLEATKEEDKEIKVEWNKDSAKVAVDDSNTRKDDIRKEPIHSQASGYSQLPVCEVEDGWVRVSILREVPSLSSLCRSLFHGPFEEACNCDPALSSFDPDHFRNSQSPCEAPPTGDDSAGSASIKSVEELDNGNKPSPTFTVALISRRSRNRAGTRYRRRGVDKDGHVANYVETEMLAKCGTHVVSYVIVRGSVPVYWTQPGYKYRPSPIIENDEEETQKAFHKHFNQQLDLYKELAVVNLVKQVGKEKALADAFEHHIILMNNPRITYIVFDFHQHFKISQNAGLKHLLQKTEGITRNMKFCWVDTDQNNSVLCKQESVFRVNCIDCLDRTNVIQSMFARDLLQSALQKLGVIPFDDKLKGSLLISFQELWGNNGDFISRQYTGTSAMKGDITRYGERKLSGLMKDGYNSAQRYYISLFRDTYRQVLIDLMQGVNPAEAFSSLPASMRGTDELDDSLGISHSQPPIMVHAPTDVPEISPQFCLCRDEALTDIIQHCKNELFADKSLHLQAWALLEAAGYSFVESSQREELCVLIQCRENSELCVVSYNLDIEQIICFMRIPMDKIEKIVIGPLGMHNLRGTRSLHMRIYYSLMDTKICYLTLKTVIHTFTEEDKSILMSIANALAYLQPEIPIMLHKLTKKNSPNHEGVIYMVLPCTWIKNWTETLESGPLRRSYDNHMTSNTSLVSTNTLESGSETNLKQEVSNKEQTGLSKSKRRTNEWSSHVFKPLTSRSHSSNDILSEGRVIPSSPTKAPSIPLLKVTFDSESTITASSSTVIPTERCGSMSESEGVALRNNPNNRHSTCSDSQLVFGGEHVLQDRESQTQTNIKRSSSDTQIRTTHQSGEESEPMGKLSRSTSKLVDNFLTFTKQSEPKTSLRDISSKESNYDSDTSVGSQFKYQMSKKLLAVKQKFKHYSSGVSRLNVSLGRSRSPQQGEPRTDEVSKQEKRKKSKSKIVIV